MPAEDPTHAELLIILNYGIGPPQESTFSYPILGRTDEGAKSVTGTITGPGGTSTMQGTVSSAPKWGVTHTVSGTRTSYFRWVTLEALNVDEFRESQQVVQAWKTVITSSGSSGDLRRVFPVLIAAAKPYVATNTEKQITEWIGEKSKKVKAIKAD